MKCNTSILPMLWRGTLGFNGSEETASDATMKDLSFKSSYNAGDLRRRELKSAASFLLWPVVGFVGAIVGGWLNSNGWPRWEWAGFFVITGSMAASGLGGRSRTDVKTIRSVNSLA